MEKLSVVVPYRDREQHLKEFIPHMERVLQNDDIQYSIIIVEQADDKPFNRAKLLNIGFKESDTDSNYFAFHDVDMLPLDSDYTYPDGPTHLASEVEQFNWGLPYDGYFGGVTLFDKQSFIDINGYSNEYWGWGAEDDDVLHRCMSLGIETYRKECKYKSLGHERNIERDPYLKNIAKLQRFQSQADPSIQIDSDGLSNLKYEKLGEKTISEKTKLIKVVL
jgi:predicted glycosyltransferase involved in capsule biosynthesis